MNKLIRSLAFVAAGATALAFGACATSTARVDKAKDSYYQTDYPIVWNAIVSAVKSEGYDRVKTEDAVNGIVVTDWHKIERVADSQATSPATRGGMDSSGALFFRAMVKVEGKKPPYKVWIDGEAAKYRPGYSSLFPYKHGDEGEPVWVQGRIDALYVAVLGQLEQYAVAPSAAQATPAPVPTEMPPADPVDPAPTDPTAPVEGGPATEPAPAPAPESAPAPTPAPKR